MNVTGTNLIGESIDACVELTKGIINNDFPELQHKYKEIRVIVTAKDSIENGSLNNVVKDFMGEGSINLTKNNFELRSLAVPPKACLEINAFIFEKFENSKKSFALRHECCHLLLRGRYTKNPRRSYCKTWN